MPSPQVTPLSIGQPAGRPLPRLLLWVFCLGAASCVSYNDKTREALDAFQGGRLDASEEAFADRDVTDSAFLSGVEAGTVAMAAGRFEAAVEYFTRAASAVEDLESEALLDPESMGRSLVGLFLNEGGATYRGEGYERATLHANLALAYLAQGLMGDVFVEVQLGNELLAAEEELYETEYAAGGLGHLISALAYELREEPDEAYIDWQALAEKGIAPELVGPALVRLARRLHRDDDLPKWIERYGEPTELPEGAARVVLIAGVGLGPYKFENRIDVATPDGLLAWSVPGLEERPQSIGKLRLEGGGAQVDSVVIEDVGRIAHKNLNDRLAWLAARSAVRAVIKREMTKKLADEHGSAGFVIGSLFSALTERADLRAWTTLPDTWQAARLLVEPGQVDLTLRAVGGQFQDLGVFELEPGETLFLLARTVGATLHVHSIGGRYVDAEPAPEPNTTP